jgi:DNA-binding transcriptional MerR regulator
MRGQDLAGADANRKKSSGPLPEIPDKLYFRIGEVARLLDLPPYVLRFWESEFPQLKPNKGGTGQRLYRRRDVETALEIRKLLYDQGYTIPGARQALKGEGRGLAAVPGKAAAVPQPARPTDPQITRLRDDSSAGRLHRMKTELRELATLLNRPSPGARAKANPAHRGLQITARRRPGVEIPPPLFAGTEEAELDLLLHPEKSPDQR